MKPAFSVLIFTVTSGAGYGLLLWMLFSQLGLYLSYGETVDLHELIGGGLLGLVLVTVGLLSSTLHLANPKNAWRAFNRFRTSWLSREGVFALMFYPAFLTYVYLVWSQNGTITAAAMVAGLLAMIIAVLVNISTGMIYASLKPIRQWHKPLTTPIYVLFSLMSGALIYLALNAVTHGHISYDLSHGYLILAAITLITKWRYFASIGKPAGATINTATSLGNEDKQAGKSQAAVRLLDAGHSAETFLTNEFGYDAGAMKLMKLRKMMWLLAFVIPAITVVLGAHFQFNGAAFFAIAICFAGLLTERWLFFAEARHVVRLYHGDQET